MKIKSTCHAALDARNNDKSVSYTHLDVYKRQDISRRHGQRNPRI